MNLSGHLNLSSIIKAFRFRIGLTWLIVIVENILMAIIPLSMGYAIDGLLNGEHQYLYLLAVVLTVLILVSVIRRIYDTRVYGTIRVDLGAELNERHQHMALSARTARLDMGRELVDFLEQQVPELLTAVIQIFISLLVLAMFSPQLAISAMLLTVAMVVLYSFFHKHFYHLNGGLNGQMERQVSILEKGNPLRLISHLKKLKSWEVKLSDTEAVLYGLIFLLASIFIIHNLWFSTQIPSISSGKIFSIVSYSWEYVEAAIMLPVALQSWSRLNEITQRINRNLEIAV